MAEVTKTHRGHWEFDGKWWWGWRDAYTIGIVWMDAGLLHTRGILLGPIRFYWQRWDGE